MESIINYKSILSDVDKDNLLDRLILVESISLHKWKLSSPYADLVYANEQDVLVVKFDLHDWATFDSEWLPEEEIFQDEPPLYFSESSHRISPVYKMRRAVSEFDLHSVYRVHSLLVTNCCYLAIEDFIPIWDKYNVSVVHQVAFDLNSIPSVWVAESLLEGVIDEENVLRAETVRNELAGLIDEIESWEDSKERWDKDLENEIEDYEPDDIEEPDDEEDDEYWLDDDIKHPGELSIAYIPEDTFEAKEWTCEIFLGDDHSVSSDNDKMAVFQKKKRCFRYTEGYRLWVRFRWNSQFLPYEYSLGEKNVIIKVLDEFGSLLKEYSVPFKKVYDVNECVRCLDLFDRSLEILVIQIYIEDLDMTSEEVYVFDFPSPFTSCFEIKGVKVYRWNRDYKITKFNQRSLGSPLRVIDMENLDTVVVYVLFRNKLGRTIMTPIPIEISLFDSSEKELCVEQAEASIIEKNGESYLEIYHKMGTSMNLSTFGWHRIWFKFMDETIGIVYFELRNFDLVGDVDQAYVNEMTERFLNSPKDEMSDVEETAMDELDKLIGLHHVKKQIKLYGETVAFVRKRKEMGLSGEYPSLHALFLGNPGTGKTKVACLLGDIMKETGHVERRSCGIRGTEYIDRPPLFR